MENKQCQKIIRRDLSKTRCKKMATHVFGDLHYCHHHYNKSMKVIANNKKP